MVNIRSDLYPLMTGWFGQSKEDVIKVRVKEAYNPLTDHFNSINEFIHYINKIKNPIDAELFIKLCIFYGMEQIITNSFTKLIMVFSIIESMTMKGEKYYAFKEWIVQKKNKGVIEEKIGDIHDCNVKSFRNILIDFIDKYHDSYGSTRNVLNFFSDYLTLKDKIFLIKSFRYKKCDVVRKFSKSFYVNFKYQVPEYDVKNINEMTKYGYIIDKDELMPTCYCWKWCYIDYGSCSEDIYCLLKQDDELLFSKLKEIVNVIYSMRSGFVHNADYPTIGEKGINIVGGIYNDLPIMVTFSIEDIENILEKGMLKFFGML